MNEVLKENADYTNELKSHREQMTRGKKIKRVLLLHIPTINYDEFDIGAQKRTKHISYPPIGLAYLGAVVRQEALDVELKIVDLQHESLKVMFATNKKDNVLQDCFDKALKDFNPDLIGMSVVCSPAIGHGLKLAQRAKEFNKDIIVAFGGVHCTFDYENILKSNSGADVVFLHEADLTFANYLKYLNREAEDTAVNGIAFIDEKKGLTKVPYASFPDFEKLPIPAWDLLKTTDYYQYSQMSGIKIVMTETAPTGIIQTERGCKASCVFCSVRNFNGKHVRARSPENVLKEIDILYNDFGIRYLDLVDDDFSFDRNRAIEICNGIIKRKYDLIWSLDNGIRPVTITAELIEKLLEAGCRVISIGVESGNKDILKKVKKPLTLKILYEKMELLHRYPELYVKANFIVGFPFETDEQIADTFRVAKEIEADQVAICIYNPLVGTDALHYMDEHELKEVEFKKIVFSKSLFRRFDNEKFAEMVYLKNLRINFSENPNYRGRNIKRALRDFLRILNVTCPDHAVAMYCVSGIYKSLGDTEQQKKYFNQFNEVISSSERWRFYCKELGIPTGDPAEAKMQVIQ